MGAMLAVPLCAVADRIPVAIISTNADSLTRTITFTYAEDSTATATGGANGTYDISKRAGGARPVWARRSPAIDSTITTAVFDKSFAEARPKTTAYWFYDMSVLNNIVGFENLCTDSVTNMSYMFYGCESLTDLDLSHFNTTAVTNMNDLLNGCSRLRSLDISSFDMTNASRTSRMFNGCTALKKLTVGNNSAVPTLHGIGKPFAPCWLIVGDGFPTAKLGEADEWGVYRWNSGYFTTRQSIELPVAEYSWTPADGFITLTFACQDVDVTTLGGGTSALYTMPESGSPEWSDHDIGKAVFDKSFAKYKPTSLSGWFKDNRSLTEIDGLENLNTSEVTRMDSMFYSCESLKSINLSLLNTSKVTNMDVMLAGCSSLKTLDLSSLALDSLKSCQYICSSCDSLRTLNVGSHDLSVFGDRHQFNYVGHRWPCILITSADFPTQKLGSKAQSGFYSYLGGYFSLDTVVDMPVATVSGYNDIGDRTTVTFSYEKGVDLTKSFSGETVVFPLTPNEPGWTGAEGNVMHGGLFRHDGMDITTVRFDESFAQVYPTSTALWFADLRNLTDIEGLEYFNTDSVVYMTLMFYNCRRLKSVDLSKLNTANVLYMEEMFRNCAALTSLDLSGFNMTKPSQVNRLLDGCTGLTQLNVGNMNIGPAYYYDIFNGVGTVDSPCKLIVGSAFPMSDLGDKLTNDAGTNYYHWLDGYFLEPVVDDTPSAIISHRVVTLPSDAPTYDLSGRRVGKEYKGVVIKKGRKYVR